MTNRPSPQTYGPLELTFPDRRDWLLTRILSQRSRTHAHKVFIREGERRKRSWTYAEVNDIVRNVGGNLHRRGLRPGDRVGIMMQNSPEYLFTWFGATIAGAIEVPINPDYKGSFLEHAISLTSPSAIVVDAASAEAVRDAGSLPLEGVRFFLLGDDDRAAAARERLSRAGRVVEPFEELLKEATPPIFDQRPHDIGAIISTSGTTGPSKGVMMSHSQLCFFAEEARNLGRITEHDTLMLDLPLFHANAQLLTTYSCLLAGADLVIFEKFSPGQFSARINEYGITFTNLLGVMMDWIMAQPERPGDRESTLRAVMSAPTPRELGARFRERFGVEATVEAFGQTEISLPVLAPYDRDRPSGAAGLLVEDYFEVKIVDPETDEELPVGEIGELIVRPKLPWIINSGYWEMPEATAESRRNVWFHTGDALRQDEGGFYYFIDRFKDALRRRGHNISSFEVESTILAFPNVQECAVIAAPSEFEGGEDEVMAVVVLDPPVEFDELASWAREKLPPYLVPRYWRVVDDLPKTPSQKIRKEVLRREGVTADTLDLDAVRS